MTMQRCDWRTAAAYVRALLTEDVEAMHVIEQHSDPIELCSALLSVATSLGILLDGDRDTLDRRLAAWLEDVGAE